MRARSRSCCASRPRSCAWSAASSSAGRSTASCVPTPASMRRTPAVATGSRCCPDDPDASARLDPRGPRDSLRHRAGRGAGRHRQRLVRPAVALRHRGRRSRRCRHRAARRPARHARRGRRVMHSTVVALADEICSCRRACRRAKPAGQPVVLVRGVEFAAARVGPSVVRDVVMPLEWTFPQIELA